MSSNMPARTTPDRQIDVQSALQACAEIELAAQRLAELFESEIYRQTRAIRRALTGAANGNGEEALEAPLDRVRRVALKSNLFDRKWLNRPADRRTATPCPSPCRLESPRSRPCLTSSPSAAR